MLVGDSAAAQIERAAGGCGGRRAGGSGARRSLFARTPNGREEGGGGGGYGSGRGGGVSAKFLSGLRSRNGGGGGTEKSYTVLSPVDFHRAYYASGFPPA